METPVAGGSAPVPRLWVEAGLGVIDDAGALVEANAALAEWLGLAVPELPGQLLGDRLASLCPGWTEAWNQLTASDGTFGQARWELPAAGSEPIQWFDVELSRVGNHRLFRVSSLLPPLPEVVEQGVEGSLGGERSGREMFSRSIRAEEQLRQLMQRWPGVIFAQRPDSSFYFVSSKIEELTGVPVKDWERQSARFWDVIHEADLQPVRQHLQRTAQSTEALTRTFRVRHVTTGKIAYVLEYRQAFTTKTGLLLGYEGTWLDLTRQTLVEKRLSAAAWKETLAALTMGLAHDFRNIMAGIVGLTETIEAQLEEKHPFHQGLSLIRTNAWQANQSIQRILQLYQGASGECTYQDCNELVQEMAETSRRMLTRRIAMETKLSEVRLPIYVDAFEFRQAFLNLAINARDAMPRGGKLVLETSRHETLPEIPFVRGKLPRTPAVCLTLSDSGSGIPERHLRSLFDPFFTTKALDKGSGLGLYNVLLFVEKHQGAVSVESPPGQGATFRLWLPEADFTEAERQTKLPGEHFTLLLLGAPGPSLEDTAEFLRQNGFYVVVASDAARGLDHLRSPYYQFAGVILQTTAQCPQFLADIKNDRLSVKTILQVIGCNPDELEASVLDRADLVLSTDTPGHQLVSRIRGLLSPMP